MYSRGGRERFAAPARKTVRRGPYACAARLDPQVSVGSDGNLWSRRRLAELTRGFRQMESVAESMGVALQGWLSAAGRGCPVGQPHCRFPPYSPGLLQVRRALLGLRGSFPSYSPGLLHLWLERPDWRAREILQQPQYGGKPQSGWPKAPTARGAQPFLGATPVDSATASMRRKTAVQDGEAAVGPQLSAGSGGSAHLRCR